MTQEKTKAEATKDEKPKDDVNMEPRWKQGDRVCAIWKGNGCYYVCTVAEVDEKNRQLTVTWDDADMSHRVVSFDEVMEAVDEIRAWSYDRIDRRAFVREAKGKGRCLFTHEAAEPGNVVFVEKPLLVTLPSLAPKLWELLQKIHETKALNLGTITFHFAALVSMVQLDKASLDVIFDKYVPEPNEEPNDDVGRILEALKDCSVDVLNTRIDTICPRRFQRLVSAWRYNSFGHHKEDGLVLYNRISMCAHSCDPSCCWSYGEEDAFVLRARMSLKKDDELTISYLQDEDLLKSIAIRQQKLQNWRFTCDCPRCCLPVDTGRGFRCQRCRIGSLYPIVAGGFQPCSICASLPSKEDVEQLLRMEDEYIVRVDGMDKKDVADVELVFQAAMDCFERHWILYVLDTMLWEAYKQPKIVEAVEHQRRRIDFHEHYYGRPTFILAWCHEELGDCIVLQAPHRKWQFTKEFKQAYQMLSILCGTNHQYTSSPFQKLWQANGETNGTVASSGGSPVENATATNVAVKAATST